MTIIRVNQVQDHAGMGLSGWEFIETQTASGDATIDVLGLSSHVVYKFFWSGLQPATESTTKFFMRTDSANGASFDAGTSDYSWVNHRISMTPTEAHDPEGDNADSEIQINGNDALGNAANELMDLEITLFNPSGTEYTKVKWEGLYLDSAATPLGNHLWGAGARRSAAAVDAVRFLYSTGNISTGTLKVYGLSTG